MHSRLPPKEGFKKKLMQNFSTEIIRQLPDITLCQNVIFEIPDFLLEDSPPYDGENDS